MSDHPLATDDTPRTRMMTIAASLVAMRSANYTVPASVDPKIKGMAARSAAKAPDWIVERKAWLREGLATFGATLSADDRAAVDAALAP